MAIYNVISSIRVYSFYIFNYKCVHTHRDAKPSEQRNGVIRAFSTLEILLVSRQSSKNGTSNYTYVNAALVAE
jgi:hypothetical protein